MSLDETRVATKYLIESTPPSPEQLKYTVAGVRRGSSLRVLCRYPDRTPLYLEVELEGGELLTLPVSLAKEIVVRPLETASFR